MPISHEPLVAGKAPHETRVVVAMSGGVDSSVVAAMLHAQGYQVIGITLQLYDNAAATHRKGACCAGQDIHDARRVAETLDIPHYVLNYEDLFKQQVIDSFVDSYLQGETPIPCVSCNQTVKFKDLLETARDLDADVMATGHYVRSQVLPNGHFGLFRPVDESRDQSYFLFATTQEQIDFLRFPLGDLTKPETRALAHEYGLIVADKPDSQDICFVPDGKYADVIQKLHPAAAEVGNIVDMHGNVLGQHEGIIHYTVGQRRGLKIAVGAPLYVVKLDPIKKHVIVGPREALATARIVIKQLNWLGDVPLAQLPADGVPVFAKVRSTRGPKAAVLLWQDGQPIVELLEHEDGVSPGQACVLYESGEADARVLGGGFIHATQAPTVKMHAAYA